MSNRLKLETSPYLLQHASNPVDWHPWDEQALSHAKQSNKPILLSIGYSSCHWCHVMAHESFADPSIAAVMNQHYVNIKVDREERPDLDKVYQTALQLINPQGGGWPLTMFLDPQTLLPFFGGTYFPKEPRYQLPGFTDLLLRLHEVYSSQKSELDEQTQKLASTLQQMTPPTLEPTLEDIDLLQQARDQLGSQYDRTEGGFGTQPKFPMPNTLERVLRHWAYARRNKAADKDGLDMVMISLTQMARGGIYDHLGGGFYRYATDRMWMIPHFEKMLYDNAQLLSLYCHALKFGQDELFEQAVVDTVAWLQRDMRHPNGGFFTSIDADAEGQEGKYYVWRREQVKQLLTDEEYLLIETLYGLDKPANFENKWNLHRYDSWRSVTQRLSLERDQASHLLATARAKMLAARIQRIPPDTDNKILTAWNGLMIRGLAHAGEQLHRPEWIAMAQQAVDFMHAQLWDGHQLHATWKDGEAKYPGYLDDYANLLDGLLTLLSVQWREQDISFAIELAQTLLAQFYDVDNGGFFFTAHEHESLIHRPKPTMDDALPPGNGIAAHALLKLGHLLGSSEFLDAAHNTLHWARGIVERVPAGHCTLLNVLEETVYAPQLVILRGPKQLITQWQADIREGFTPWRSVYAIGYEDSTTLPQYLPRLVSMEQQQQVTAYVCSGLQCSLPIKSLEELRQQLI